MEKFLMHFKKPSSSLFEVLRQPKLLILLSILALLLQNLVIFRNHYFLGYGFPWDFPREYYTVVVFWTTAIQNGIFPQWNPFSSMGVPFLLNMQTGLFYPPLWIFPIFKIPYSLHSAVVFECLHVLFGTLGMYLFLREKTKQNVYALIGAVVFQFFGGFYSNSEHLDIIRGFAYTPWMLYLFSLSDSWDLQKGFWFHKKFLLIPLFVYMFITGSYPGNYLAGLFLIAVYFVFQIYLQLHQRRGFRQVSSQFISVSVLSAIGILIAAVYLGPIVVGRDNIGRFLIYQDLERMNFSLAYLPSLIFSNVRLPGEISMNSLFITVPAFVLLFLINQRSLRKHPADAVMLFFSGILSFGSFTVIWKGISRILFPLQISRFPSSDYRAFFAIFLILFGLYGLRALRSGAFTFNQLLLRAFLCLLVFLQFADMIYQLEAGQLLFAAIAMILTWLIIFVFKVSSVRLVLQRVLLLLFIGVVVADGLSVLKAMNPEWVNKDMEKLYLGKLNSSVVDRFTDPPATRPAREPVDTKMFWGGNLSGVYNSGAPCQLKTCSEIHGNSTYVDYMLKPWTPILFVNPEITPKRIEESIKGLASVGSDPRVQQVRYGINEIVYQVNLEQPMLMIENEIYFPGWEGYIVGAGNEKLSPVPIDQVFRGWNLPAGKYRFRTRFVYPYFNLFVILSIVGLCLWALWAAIIVLYETRKKKFLQSALEADSFHKTAQAAQ